jgi:hypothetical protein
MIRNLVTRAWRTVLALLMALVLTGVGQAQGLLLDVTLSSAIAAQLNPGIRLPRQSLRAVGPGADTIIARVPDAADWTDWEVYTASGFVRNLQPAFAHNIVTEFALNGLFENERSESEVGAELHTRYVFDDGIDRALLYVISTPSEVVWMIARGR